MKEDFKVFTKKASSVYHELSMSEREALKQRAAKQSSLVLTSAARKRAGSKIFAHIQKLVRY